MTASLDLAAIARAQRVAALALRLRARHCREATQQLGQARAALAAAQAAQVQADAALLREQAAHREAVRACTPACTPAGTQRPGAAGGDLLSLMAHCHRLWQAIAARRVQCTSARATVAHAESGAAECAAALARSRRRLEQAQTRHDEWLGRKALACEMHAELAADDDAPRAGRVAA